MTRPLLPEARRPIRPIIEVSWLAEPAGRGEGIGLSNTRERLRASYGADHAFDVSAGAAGGVVARLELPAPPALPRTR